MQSSLPSLAVALFKRNSVKYTQRTSSLSAAQFTVKSLISSDLQRLIAVVDLGEGPREARPPPLILGEKKKEMSEGRKAGWASKIEPGPLLSSLNRN